MTTTTTSTPVATTRTTPTNRDTPGSESNLAKHSLANVAYFLYLRSLISVADTLVKSSVGRDLR